MSEAQIYLDIAIWSQVASSICFIAALAYIWIRFVQPALLAARERGNEQLARAERHRDEVRDALTALRDEIDRAHHDAELILHRADLHAQRERDAVLAEANAAGERTLREAGGELERARAAARLRLRDALVGRALEIARGQARERVGPALDARLVEGLGTSLERSHG